MEICWRELAGVKVKKENSTNSPHEQTRKEVGIRSQEESACLFYKANSTGWIQHKHAGGKQELQQRWCFALCTGFIRRIQQLDTKANIKNSYIHTHTTSWHWHCPVEVSYWVNMASQTTSINRQGKQCKNLMMDWDAAPRGRGAGQIVIILITAMCSTTHAGKFNQTGRWRQQQITHSHTGRRAKHVLSIRK